MLTHDKGSMPWLSLKSSTSFTAGIFYFFFKKKQLGNQPFWVLLVVVVVFGNDGETEGGRTKAKGDLGVSMGQTKHTLTKSLALQKFHST